jgi:predicted nucleotidyltransferase
MISTTKTERRWRFQAALHTALVTYLHGTDLTRASRALFPIVASGAPRGGEVRHAAAAMGLSLRGTLPELLAGGYGALDDLDPPAGEMREFELSAWDAARHGRIPALRHARRRLLDVSRSTGLEFVLHGSFASLDFTGYSDLDTFVLIPRTIAVDPDALRAARASLVRTWRALKEFDPLQHHGHFILTEIDLRGYPDPLLPTVILERTVALASRRRLLRARSLPAPTLAAERFFALAHRFLRTDLRRGLGNAYRLKSDLSVFMLLPALWCQARGRPIDKKRSFGAVYPLLSAPSVEAFRRAAEIRSVWQYAEPPTHRWIRRLWINPLLPAALDAARARPPAPAIRRLADDGFLHETKVAVRELMELYTDGGPRLHPLA